MNIENYLNVCMFPAILFAGCTSAFQTSYKDNTNIAEQDSVYKIIKIDSVNSYYVISVDKIDQVFKIISKKDFQDKNCEQIEVGSKIPLQLQSILNVGNKKVIPSNQIQELSGWRLDDSTTIIFEKEDVRDLFISRNLSGLCHIAESQTVR